jgi:hypothetical protein
MNDNSSRSHAIVRLYIESRPLSTASGALTPEGGCCRALCCHEAARWRAPLTHLTLLHLCALCCEQMQVRSRMHSSRSQHQQWGRPAAGCAPVL